MKNLEHSARVRAIQARMRELAAAGVRGVKIYHGSTNSTRALRFDAARTVDASGLDHILEIDTVRKLAVVEPNVNMETLVRETGLHGLVPAVVPEFPNITVGGAVAGGAAESSSYKHGLVHELCDEYEVVLGDGALVRASAAEHADLFRALAGSYGSLGVLTAVTMRLVPATKYVRVRYLPVGSFEEARQTILREWDNPDNDFVDGILFARNRGVIVVGRRTNERDDLPLARFRRAHDQWFYLHAEELALRDGGEEVVPLADFLFRYDRGAFWMGYYAFPRFHIPFNAVTRWLHNPLLKTGMLYRALQESRTGQEYFVQDISVPEENIVPLLEESERRLGIYPLWLCPLRPDPAHPFSPTNLKATPAHSLRHCPRLSAEEKKSFDLNNIGDEKERKVIEGITQRCHSECAGGRIINAGIWGPHRFSHDEFVQVNREMEGLTAALGGRKILYAHVYQPEDEFWQSYDREAYHRLRAQYHAEPFADLFTKVAVKERYTTDVKRGFFRALRPRWKLKQH